MDEEEIRALLAAGLGEACEIEIAIEGSHLILKLVGNVFTGLSRLKRQQLVNRLLEAKIGTGEIHAVRMSCLSPDDQ